VIGLLGILEDVSKHLTAGFKGPGANVFLLGASLDAPAASLGGSEYLEAVHGMVAGLPAIDLAAERRLQKLVLAAHAEGLLSSAHDCSDGGLATALAESSIIGDTGLEGATDLPGRLDSGLFGEAQGRIVVSTPSDHASGRLTELAGEMGVPITWIGRTIAGEAFTFGPIATTTRAMREAWESLV
jgi:phosphoribosylformylglycinamidine synthase